MFHKVCLTGLLILAMRASLMATPAIPQDTVGRSASTKQNSRQSNQPSHGVKETASQVKETVIKSVPKARNQQIPRPVIPRIRSVSPEVKVKTKINTKIRIKL